MDPNLRQSLIVRLVSLLPDDKKISEQEAAITWWFNIRESGGLRLTDTGLKYLRDILDLESWSVDLHKHKVDKKLLLALDRKVTFPYYIDRKQRRIIFFNSREAMMVMMYGDIERWVNSLS